MNRKAFSLIELMVAVSILAIGIVLIARSFLSASNALTNGDNRILALELLEAKMTAIEEDALKGNDKLMDADESVRAGSKTFAFKVESERMGLGEESAKDNIKKVVLTAAWKEGNRDYDEILGAYIGIITKE